MEECKFHNTTALKNKMNLKLAIVKSIKTNKNNQKIVRKIQIVWGRGTTAMNN